METGPRDFQGFENKVGDACYWFICVLHKFPNKTIRVMAPWPRCFGYRCLYKKNEIKDYIMPFLLPLSFKSHGSSTSWWRTRPKVWWLFSFGELPAGGSQRCSNCWCQNRLYFPREIPCKSCLTRTCCSHHTRNCNCRVCDCRARPWGTRISKGRLWNRARLTEGDYSQTIWDLFTKVEEVSWWGKIYGSFSCRCVSSLWFNV